VFQLYSNKVLAELGLSNKQPNKKGHQSTTHALAVTAVMKNYVDTTVT
jgi:hypothetical protein